jgi:hypothetical protein
MRHVADRPGLTAGQVPGPGSTELLVDLLLLHRLAQLPVLLDGHGHRYHLTALADYVVVSPAGSSLMAVMVTMWTDSMTSQHSSVPALAHISG